MAEQHALLADFGKCARLLAQWLDEGGQLTSIEQVSLDNHLHVVHFSYGAWKRKQKHQQSVDDQTPPPSP